MLFFIFLKLTKQYEKKKKKKNTYICHQKAMKNHRIYQQSCGTRNKKVWCKSNLAVACRSIFKMFDVCQMNLIFLQVLGDFLFANLTKPVIQWIEMFYEIQKYVIHEHLLDLSKVKI